MAWPDSGALRGSSALALCAAVFAGSAPPSRAAPPAPSCEVLAAMDEQLGDLEFDLGNLRVVLDNVYDSPDRKKHDEEFRIKMLINVVGRLQEEAPRTGDDELKGAIAQVGSGFEDLKTAVGDQFVVAQDEHYDNFSSIHYRTPRLTGGTPAAPEAYGAIDSLNDDRQGAADVVDSLRGNCPSD